MKHPASPHLFSPICIGDWGIHYFYGTKGTLHMGWRDGKAKSANRPQRQ